MVNKYFTVLIEAKDNESFFFQNFYPYCKSKKDAVDIVSEYLISLGYTEIKVEEISVCDNILDIEGIKQEKDFDGFIQDIKHAY
jgi:hypothetical protein